MIAAERVDLPVPFGPMIAAISPVFRVRLTLLKFLFLQSQREDL